MIHNTIFYFSHIVILIYCIFNEVCRILYYHDVIIFTISTIIDNINFLNTFIQLQILYLGT